LGELGICGTAKNVATQNDEQPPGGPEKRTDALRRIIEAGKIPCSALTTVGSDRANNNPVSDCSRLSVL
jgi:hypothetical protein